MVNWNVRKDPDREEEERVHSEEQRKRGLLYKVAWLGSGIYFFYAVFYATRAEAEAERDAILERASPSYIKKPFAARVEHFDGSAWVPLAGSEREL